MARDGRDPGKVGQDCAREEGQGRVWGGDCGQGYSGIFQEVDAGGDDDERVGGVSPRGGGACVLRDHLAPLVGVCYNDTRCLYTIYVNVRYVLM